MFKFTPLKHEVLTGKQTVNGVTQGPVSGPVTL
jgi:hypothetical protein